jgi:thymidylate kinase
MIAIALTGQDGAGKSTQAEKLFRKLSAGPGRVARVHQFEPATWVGRTLAPAAKRLANRVMRSGKSDEPDFAGRDRGGRKAGFARSVLATTSLVVGWMRSRSNLRRHRRHDVLILDRCFADEMIRVAHKFGTVPGFGFRLLTSLAPKPSLVISFTLDERSGWERKKTREMSFAEYQDKIRRARSVLARVDEHWEVVTLPVDGLDPDEVFERVWSRVRSIVARDG